MEELQIKMVKLLNLESVKKLQIANDDTDGKAENQREKVTYSGAGRH